MNNAQLPSSSILDDIIKEYLRAKKRHPGWPVHPAGQAGVVVEEAGELMRACMNMKYKTNRSGKNKEEMKQAIRLEAIQTAAVCIRFLENLK